MAVPYFRSPPPPAGARRQVPPAQHDQQPEPPPKAPPDSLPGGWPGHRRVLGVDHRYAALPTSAVTEMEAGSGWIAMGAARFLWARGLHHAEHVFCEAVATAAPACWLVLGINYRGEAQSSAVPGSRGGDSL